MKVLYDHQIFSVQKFGGISRYFNELIQFNTAAVTTETIDHNLVEIKPQTGRPNLFFRGVNYAKRRVGINTNPKLPKTPKAIVDILENGNYDVFHPTYYDPYFLDYVRKPFVLTVHDMIHEIYREMTYADNTTSRKRVLCTEATHIIAISHKTKEDLVQIFGIDPHKISVVYHGSTFGIVKPALPKQLPKEIEKYILFVGQRTFYKNFYFMVTALANLLKKDSKLHLINTGVPFSEQEQAFFREYGIEDKVHSMYCKTDEELAWMYKQAELFIFPSEYEGFGFPLLEAFACECPVICSTGGSLPEVAGDAAIYFDPKKFLELEEAAEKVLYNKQLKEELVQKGKQQLGLFSWDKCRLETLDVYKKVMRIS